MSIKFLFTESDKNQFIHISIVLEKMWLTVKRKLQQPKIIKEKEHLNKKTGK